MRRIRVLIPHLHLYRFTNHYGNFSITHCATCNEQRETWYDTATGKVLWSSHWGTFDAVRSERRRYFAEASVS